MLNIGQHTTGPWRTTSPSDCSDSHASLENLKQTFSSEGQQRVCIRFGHTKSGSASRGSFSSTVNTRQSGGNGDGAWRRTERLEGKRKNRGVRGVEGTGRNSGLGGYLGGGCVCLERKDFCWEETVKQRKWTGAGDRPQPGMEPPGPSQTPTHLLVVANLILRAVGPRGSRSDRLSPRQGHTLGFHSVPANLILLPGS